MEISSVIRDKIAQSLSVPYIQCLLYFCRTKLLTIAMRISTAHTNFPFHLQHVLTQSVRIMTSYKYVTANVTTLEGRRLCYHEHGTEVCDMDCQLDSHQFWCSCDKVSQRVNAAQVTFLYIVSFCLKLSFILPKHE